MADISDVLTLLAGKVAAAVYPHGTAMPSVANADIRVYPGWPVPNVLDADLAAGCAHISLYPLSTERNSSRHIGRPWRVTRRGTSTLTATVGAESVTFGGAIDMPSMPQNVYLRVDGVGYVYAVQTGDTLPSVATAMAMLIPGASSAGPVVTLPAAHSIVARIGAVGTAMRELRRQEKQIQITIWAPRPDMRDTVARAVDSVLAESSSLVFADGSDGILRYSRTHQSDQAEKALLYRRDLIYSADYATTQTIDAPQVIAPVITVSDNSGGNTVRIVE